MGRPLRILIVEDSESDAQLLLAELRQGGYEPEYDQVWTPEDMRQALKQRRWDLIISDWSMPRFTGLDAFSIAREWDPDIPFMIVSGTIGEEIAVEALHAGVQDFMTKGMFARLIPAIDREMREAQERRRRHAAELEVVHRRREIESSERLLRLVIDSVPDGVAVIDTSGRPLLWNQPADPLFASFDTAATDPEPPLSLFHPDTITPHSNAVDLLKRALHGEALDSYAVFVCGPAAPKGAHLSVNARPLRDADGTVRGAVGVFRDVTRERASHEQLMISDRMASIGMLAAGVGHEINNPLAAVLANLEMVKLAISDREKAGHLRDTGELHEMLDDAQVAINRVRSIVRDLKMFSRHEYTDTRAVEIHSVLESSIRMAWNEIRHRACLVKDFGPDARVMTSESRLGQVFLNLIVNAAQAIDEGDANANTIRIATRLQGDDRIVVEVADTGSGIAPDALRHLFTPFFTTKPVGVGTGLGLVICERIVDGLGGKIEVESELGQGTTIRVLLPLADATSSHAPQPIIVEPARRRGRVLMVDDEPLMGPAVRRILSREHDVTITTRASEALQRIHSGELYDVILCDLMMPEMSGMELHAAILQAAPEQASRMIFVTGGAFTPSARSFLDHVPNDRLEKPFDSDRLRAIVNHRIAG
ncbi:response regulator [Tahibacter amnicola]|uniref:histidine kinase n=1 Tax=Tahibacter amnicola TaxID=2976241 RepID=A0ABY6BJ57_9GAMM|nr:response regulator [Tahibacter amnicola]UXI70043.1 response regulator [Tahibacter amnicola]